MLKRHGFGLGEAIVGVVALGALGVVGFSMFSGECMLSGGCDAGKASSAPITSVTTVVADEKTDCSGGGCQDAPSQLILASDAGEAHDCASTCETACDATCDLRGVAMINVSESNMTVVKGEGETECESACSKSSECESEKPLD